jgi:hypothetical protein
LLNAEGSDVRGLVVVFLNLVAVIVTRFPGLHQLELLHSLLSLTGAFVYRRCIVEHFGGLCPILCAAINKFTIPSFAKNIHREALSFLAVMSEYLPLTEVEVHRRITTLVGFPTVSFVFPTTSASKSPGAFIFARPSMRVTPRTVIHVT